MNNFIYDLFLEEEDLLNAPYPQEKELQETQIMFEHARERLHEGLDRDQRRLLLSLVDQHTMALQLTTEASFLRGFQIGGRLVAELLR